MPWFSFFECISELFNSSLSPSSRGSWIPLHFLPVKWYHLHIWGCWYFSWQSWFQLVSHPAPAFHMMCSAYILSTWKSICRANAPTTPYGKSSDTMTFVSDSLSAYVFMTSFCKKGNYLKTEKGNINQNLTDINICWEYVYKKGFSYIVLKSEKVNEKCKYKHHF